MNFGLLTIFWLGWGLSAICEGDLKAGMLVLGFAFMAAAVYVWRSLHLSLVRRAPSERAR